MDEKSAVIFWFNDERLLCLCDLCVSVFQIFLALKGRRNHRDTEGTKRRIRFVWLYP